MLGEETVESSLGEQVRGEGIIRKIVTTGGSLRGNLVRQMHSSPRGRGPGPSDSRCTDLMRGVSLMLLVTVSQQSRVRIVQA